MREYERPEAKEKFEQAMRTAFQAPKPAKIRKEETGEGRDSYFAQTQTPQQGLEPGFNSRVSVSHRYSE